VPAYAAALMARSAGRGTLALRRLLALSNQCNVYVSAAPRSQKRGRNAREASEKRGRWRFRRRYEVRPRDAEGEDQDIAVRAAVAAELGQSPLFDGAAFEEIPEFALGIEPDGHTAFAVRNRYRELSAVAFIAAAPLHDDTRHRRIPAVIPDVNLHRACPVGTG
jgi:hypothetical protein